MSPLISVVLPVYNVEPYLSACLRSIMCQPFRDIEVIAVDGHSTDGSLEILQRRSEVDPRLQVVPKKDRIGPGRARNVGIECAKGEYLWFVDADDLIEPDCLDGIARRIEESRPDVLLVGFSSFYPDGAEELGHGCWRLQQAPSSCFRLAQEPWAVDLTMASWGKLIRREFLLSLDAGFLPDPPHEDIPLSSRVLLKAEKIAVFPKVCYHYRRGRPGSLMAETAGRHFNIFRSYEIVFREMECLDNAGDRRVDGGVRKAFFERAIQHYSTILDGDFFGKNSAVKGLIPHSMRRDFFRRMHRDFVLYRPAGYHPGLAFRDLKSWLIGLNAYRLYSWMLPVNSARLRLARALAERGRSAPPPGGAMPR